MGTGGTEGGFGFVGALGGCYGGSQGGSRRTDLVRFNTLLVEFLNHMKVSSSSGLSNVILINNSPSGWLYQNYKKNMMMS